jgi:CheY-like chemotaxis protein/nitrogen-specific signal transduction histidine kinase
MRQNPEEEIARLNAELERLQLERGRDVANLMQVAKAAIASKNGFLTNMSHELRTPLTAIIGFSELLSDQHFGKLNERQYVYVREIYNAGQHLLTLIKDILDLAKTESGLQALQLTSVDICALVENSLSMVKERAIKHGQILETDFEDSVRGLVIQADEIKLKQILFNLLSNAVKFSPDHGQVKVIVRRFDRQIFISVCDSGVGIRSEDLEKIFDVFEQSESSYSKQIHGAGIGLALTRKLVELHGGDISAHSQGIGKGATLTFSIPCEVVTAPSRDLVGADRLDQVDSGIEMPAWAEMTDPDRLVALVIEDNSSNLKLLVDLLEREGYRSLVASSAEEAIDIAQHSQPDIILMDLSLPGMDGLEATRLLKKDSQTLHIPVIAVTANALKIDEARAIEAGCDAYLSKPINPKTFVSILDRFKKQ